MKTSFLSEVQNSFRRLFVAARVEKYIRVSNQWLLANSGKVLEHAHRVAQQLRGVELEKYFNTGKEWLLDTPERALTHAYDAALLLKKIEDEHFAGNPVTSISNYSDGVSSYFQLISRKHLILIQVRLLEFKASHVILDVQSFNQDVFENNGEASPILEQLKFIDDVLTRYQAQSSIPANSSDLITGQAIETPELEIHSQPNRQWQLLEALHLNFGKENTSQDAQSIITVESPSPSPQLIPRPISNLVAASMLFTGGLVIGGLSSWLLLSTQNQANEGSKRLNSTEVNPDHAHTETSTPNLTARLSPPETLPPESSLTKINSGHSGESNLGEPTKHQAVSHQVTEATPRDRALNKISNTHGMIRPSTPETLPPERSAPATLTSEHTVYSPTSTERTTQLPAQDTTQPPTPVKHTTHPHPKIQNPKSKIQAAVSSTTTRERRLTQADLQGRSARELTIMRNEIYARHGRKFYEPELKSHFEQQSWYRPRYISAEFPVSLLSEIEMHNAILIREYQFDHGLWD